MATLEQIQAKLKKLQAQAEAIVVKQSSGVLEKIHGLMEKHGLTTADIDAHAGNRKRRPKAGAKTAAKVAKSVAKYQDPKSGATWSGHGRAPGWIAGVKDRSRFLVDSKATGDTPAATTKAKTAGNYARGPQPALFRDPRTGATWSGRGRAPAWLANARDRSKFSIAGEAAPVVLKTARAPKAAAEKAAAKGADAANKTTAGKKKPAKKSRNADKAGAVKKIDISSTKPSAAKKGVPRKITPADVTAVNAGRAVAQADSSEAGA